LVIRRQRLQQPGRLDRVGAADVGRRVRLVDPDAQSPRRLRASVRLPAVSARRAARATASCPAR